VRPRTAVQAPGQAVGVLASLPAAGLPSFLELNHTVPTSPSHPALDPNRTIQRAHGGPPDRVELLQRVGRAGHGRIILTSTPTRKTSRRTHLWWCRALPAPAAALLVTRACRGPRRLGARSRMVEKVTGLALAGRSSPRRRRLFCRPRRPCPRRAPSSGTHRSPTVNSGQLLQPRNWIIACRWAAGQCFPSSRHSESDPLEGAFKNSGLGCRPGCYPGRSPGLRRCGVPDAAGPSPATGSRDAARSPG
jgi:hypothetical protein